LPEKISVSEFGEFTTDYTVTYDITQALEEWKHPLWASNCRKTNQMYRCIDTECICL